MSLLDRAKGKETKAGEGEVTLSKERAATDPSQESGEKEDLSGLSMR